MVANQFAFESSGDAPASSHDIHYVSAMDKLLASLSSSKSLFLIDSLVPVICRETDPAREDAHNTALGRFAYGAQSSAVMGALDRLMTIFSVCS